MQLLSYRDAVGMELAAGVEKRERTSARIGEGRNASAVWLYIWRS